MGTETKLNCYSENSNSGCVPNVRKNSTENNLLDSATEQKDANSDNKCFTNIRRLSAESSQTNVPHIPILIDEHNVIEGAKAILRVIRHDWNLNDVRFKTFTDGITNKLVGCFYSQNKAHLNINICNTDSSGSESTQNGSHKKLDTALNDDNNDSGNISDVVEDETANMCENVVLVRVYGNKTDLLIDRKAETRNFILLHSYGFAPSLYATFRNGLAYDYVPGITLNSSNVLCEDIWKLVARRMAEMHRVVKVDTSHTEGDPIPMLFKKTQRFLDLVPERFTSADKHKRLDGTFLPISRMRDEFEKLYAQLQTLGSPLVFSHNDLLLGNVIYTESQQAVSFIDYEYADYNFQAFDIGNHFAEFAGVDVVDYSYYPSKKFQLKWLRVYLQVYLQRDNIGNDEVDLLYVQVNQFALAAHFFWTIWSLIQAEHSNIDFDYVEYAFIRYNEYLAKKDDFLSLMLTK